MKNRKRLLALIGFVLIFLFLFRYIQNVLRPNGFLTDTQGEAAGATWAEFYDLEKNSLDVIYLGSSSMFHGISPMEIWNESGITGFDLGSHTQRPWVSYYFLQEALKTQKPRVVVLDMYAWMWTGGTSGEGHAHNAFDYTRFSLRKMEAVENSIYNNGFDCGSIYDYLFPAFRYHSRWESLSEEDFRSQNDYTCFKGMAFGYQVNDCTEGFNRINETHTGFQVDENVKYYVQKVIDLCKEENIEIVLVKVPVYEWKITYSEQIEQLARENEIEFIDFNYMLDEIGINPTTDFTDGSHLNVGGAEKLSRWIASYLSKYDFEDKRENVLYSEWESDYQKYIQYIADHNVQATMDFKEYMSLLDSKNYDILLYRNGVADDYSAVEVINGKTDETPFNVEDNLLAAIISGDDREDIYSTSYYVTFSEENADYIGIQLSCVTGGEYRYAFEVGEDGWFSIKSNSTNAFLTEDENGVLSAKELVDSRWRLIHQGDSKFSIKSESEKVWDISGGKVFEGANVQLYDRNDSLAQCFYLYKVSDDGSLKLCDSEETLESGEYVIVSALITLNKTFIHQTKGRDSSHYSISVSEKGELCEMLVEENEIVFQNDGKFYFYVYDNLNDILVDKAVVKKENETWIIIHEK